MNKSTINEEEVRKFSSIADEWWQEDGKFKPLHKINKTRLTFLKEQIENHFKQDFAKISVIDIGCGGGLICEPLKRLGFNITGIDASQKNIAIAENHAKSQDLDINYICSSAEELVKTDKKYDVVLALEIIEHVEEVEFFIESCSKLANKGGIIIFSTLNRTVSSFIKAIIGAEYILKWLPHGTHDWQKFLKPSEIVNFAENYNLTLINMTGMNFDILQNSWYLSEKIDVNYLISFTKY